MFLRSIGKKLVPEKIDFYNSIRRGLYKLIRVFLYMWSICAVCHVITDGNIKKGASVVSASFLEDFSRQKKERRSEDMLR